MLKHISIILLSIISISLHAQTAGSNSAAAKPQTGREYPDGHGGKVYLPLGELSFADEVVSFTKGDPPAVEATDPQKAKGRPDYDGQQGGFLSLGCGGTLILQFKDNALINVKGPDLYVFELGRYTEATDLSVSKDGTNWIKVGRIEGGKAAVDIGDSVKQGEIFYYVRLTDLGTACYDSWAGADIDAVAAIGSAKRISLGSTVLFDVDKAVLKSEAKTLLDKVADDINNDNRYEIVIEGHTDSTGTLAHNKQLSANRSLAVKKYLYSKLTDKTAKMSSVGYADKYPAAPNRTEEGRDKNRRVEIILIPKE